MRLLAQDQCHLSQLSGSEGGLLLINAVLIIYVRIVGNAKALQIKPAALDTPDKIKEEQ